MSVVPRSSSTVMVGVVVLSAVAGCVSLPRPGRPALPDVEFRIRDFRLANGMRIIVEEDHATPLVGVFAVVDVGSTDDPPGKEGLAHLIEHLAFRARPGGKATAWRQLEEAGVSGFNASTSFDTTTYFELGTKDLLPKLLSLEAGRLLNPLLGVDEKAFEVEREVVRNELRERGENALGPAFHFLQEAAFPKEHPYSRPVGGNHQSLSAITFEDAKRFAAEHYRPANITLLVLGDVDLTTVQEPLIRGLPSSLFELKTSKDPFPARLTGDGAEPPPPPPTRLSKRQALVAGPELYVVWSLPRAFDTEMVMLDFATVAADRELSEAFFSDPNLVDVSVFSVPGAQASMLVARATLKRADRAETSYERLLDQLVRLWASGESGREYAETQVDEIIQSARTFSRLRNGAVMGMMLGADDLANRGADRARSTHFTGNPLTYSRRLRALGAVTPTQVARYAERYLVRSRARAVLVEPFAPDASPAVSGSTGLESGEAEPFTTAIAPDAANRLGKAHSERAKRTAAAATKPDQLVEVLPNGLKVVLRRRRDSLPVVLAHLTFPTGSAGTTPRGAAELASLLARPKSRTYGAGGEFGIHWRTRVAADHSTISGSGASGNLPNMLAQLSERVTSMHVDPAVVTFFDREFADAFALAERLPLVRAERELDGALFKGHPLGETAPISEQRILSSLQLDEWFYRAWTPDGAVLVVVGALDPEATLAEVKRWFARWDRSPRPFPPLSAPSRPPAPSPVVVTHQPNATQARLHLACLTPSGSTKEVLAGQATANLLERALFGKARVELGASYGFHGTASRLPAGVQRLDWEGAVENRRLAEVLPLVFGAVRAFEAQLLAERAVERARWDVARGLTLEDSTARRLAALLSQQALDGREAETTEARFAAAAGLGRPELLEQWRACRGSLAVGILGDEATIRAALGKASLDGE